MKAILILFLVCFILPSYGNENEQTDWWPEHVNVESDIFLGIQGESISKKERQKHGNLLPPDVGLCATCVVEGSPAAQAGLRSGDILISIDDYPLQSPVDLLLSMRDVRPGDVVQVKFLRRGKVQTVPVTVAARPQPVVVAVAHRLPSPPLQESLEEIQAQQVELARLLAASCPSCERILGRFDDLEQLTNCRRPSKNLYLCYMEGRKTVLVMRKGDSIIINWGADKEQKTEIFARDEDRLSRPLRDLLKAITIRHRRISGVSADLKWQKGPAL